MAMFHVFVDGAVDTSPDALQRLAAAMSRRYGLPEADLVARMSKGRFRVKANIDQATAQTYARDLQAIGARVVIEAVQPDGARAPAPGRAPATSTPAAGVARPPASPLPPAGAARPAASSLPPANTAASSLPPASAPRPAASSLPPANTARPSAPQFQSGLAAAFSQEIPVASSLGALESAGDSLSLASLDGHDAPSSGGSFDAPDGLELSASIGPPAARPPAPSGKPPAGAKAERPKDIPLDLFAPPEEAGEIELAVELATDELEDRARKRASTPPATSAAPPPTSPVLQRKSAPSLAPANVPATSHARTEMPRGRFAAGVVIALVLGFIPAHFIGAMREATAYAEIDQRVEAYQSQLDSDEAYEGVDAFRRTQLEHKRSARMSIALASSGVWIVVAGVFAFVWFRVIKWDRVAQRS